MNEPDCKSELAYLNSIYAGLEGLGARADETETSVAGRKENRLNEINLEEVFADAAHLLAPCIEYHFKLSACAPLPQLLYCAATLYEANEDAIRRLKAERDPSSAGTPFSSSKGGANRPAGIFQYLLSRRFILSNMVPFCRQQHEGEHAKLQAAG